MGGTVVELRVALVMVPPLLADLIRHVVTVRFDEASRLDDAGEKRLGVGLRIVAEIGDPGGVGERLGMLAPHVVIYGPTATGPIWAAVALPRYARVLTLSADLTRIHGPGPGDSAPLTPDVLADRLHDISQTI